MFSEDIEMEEMYSITSFADRYDGHELLKMKAWMADVTLLGGCVQYNI